MSGESRVKIRVDDESKVLLKALERHLDVCSSSGIESPFLIAAVQLATSKLIIYRVQKFVNEAIVANRAFEGLLSNNAAVGPNNDNRTSRLVKVVMSNNVDVAVDDCFLLHSSLA